MNDLECCFSNALAQHSLPSLQDNQRGRSLTRDVCLVHGAVSPVGKGRKDDVNPEYYGENFAHTRWCRQARRLQSLLRLLQSNRKGNTHQEHAISLWKSILSAPGFRFGFAQFWRNRCIRLVGAPEELCLDCPTLDRLRISCIKFFLAEFRKLESILNSTRVCKAAQARKGNPNLIFRDVARRRALPVQTLLCKSTSTVVGVSSCRKIVTVEPPIDLGNPIFSEQGMLAITEASSTAELVLDSEHPVSVDDVLFQERLTCSNSEVFQAFHDLWSPRWNKHEGRDDSRWDPFVHFVKSHVPRPGYECPCNPISYDDWMHIVRSKKPSCATGPDGISREDLLKLPKPLVLRLLKLIRHSINTWTCILPLLNYSPICG